MDNTPFLGLPYILPSQAQKHVTHNEALRILDALAQLCVESRNRRRPPAEPQEGHRYVIPSEPQGEWEGKENQIAAFQDGAWSFHSPRSGWLAFDRSEARLIAFDGGKWISLTGSSGKLGVNAQADDVNRLSVKSDAVLLSHDDVSPGSGDMRLTINKKQEDSTASVIFQNDWSGRAEFGLAGDDRWSVKVSSDGSQWKEALVCDQETGKVQFPNGIHHPLTAKRPEAIFPVHERKPFYRYEGTRDSRDRTAVVSSIQGDEIMLTQRKAHYLFPSELKDSTYVRIWNTSVSPRESAWVKEYLSRERIKVVDEESISGWRSGHTIQLGDQTIYPTPQPSWVACDVSKLMTRKYGAPFRQSGIIARYSVSGSSFSLSRHQSVAIGISATDQPGEFFDGYSRNNGYTGTGMLYAPCSILSPLSNSNLIFVRELAPTRGMQEAGLWIMAFSAPM